ncbi:hypothetical protein [Dermatobacter hominis]|uniref:hypothetical protein n=1 Tax=Dermatobacter hominis TaxID=2884263 RepID=UPI001D12AB0C|nr:hypothetical protein [Dermatobacter hominis]UDY37816.1 hypothetical protein LH044_09800 [Dermatobacter hominis]
MADQERTYSIWPFLILFVVLGTVGLIGILAFGSPSSPTGTIPSFTTTSTTPTTEPPEDTTPVTVPGGAAAPEGVRDVVAEGDATSYAFQTPESLATVPLRAVVARAQATPDAAGTSLVLEVACTASADEVLGQVSVTETATSVTVLPVVVLAAEGTAPCAPGAAPREVTLPLERPIGSRSVVLVPAGTEVPAPGP